jgi:imidazolonepropionase-like amidohydrolase
LVADETLVLSGGTLIDGRGSLPVTDSVVVIKGNTIESVGRVDEVPVVATARVIEVRGKTVMPGLVDCHLHLGTSGGGLCDPEEFRPTTLAANLRTLLGYGVTSVMDLAAQPHLDKIQAELRSGALLGPRLFGVKYGITAPGSHPMGLLREFNATGAIGANFIEVDNVDAAREAVRRVAAEKPDGLKIYHSRTEFPGTMCLDCNCEKLRPEVLKALVDEGHAQGLKVYAHIAYPSEAREVLVAGADVLSHPITHAETTVDEIMADMAARGTVMHTTLTRVEAYFGLMVDPFMREKLRGRVAPVILRSIGLPKSKAFIRHNRSGVTEDARRILDITMANVRRAVKAGVTIAMGTDSGGPGAMHGVCVPREMELMNEAGMTPMQVLVAATKTAADVIGQGDRIGTIEPGKLADVLVIDGEPLRDISHIRKLSAVIANGRMLDPAELTVEPEKAPPLPEFRM